MATTEKTTEYTHYKQKEAKQYNKEIKEVPNDKAREVTLLGKRILVKPFKFVDETDSGLIVPNVQNTVDDETGRRKAEESEQPFQSKGVICNISDECSDDLKRKAEVGDIVHLAPSSFVPFQSDKNYRDIQDEYFTSDVPEGRIVGIEKQQQTS